MLRWNEFTDKIDLRGPPWHADDAPAVEHTTWQDDDDVRLVAWLHRSYSLKTSPEVAHQVAQVVAAKSPCHPVREYLDGLAWDGKARLPSLLHVYLGAEDTPYHAAIGLRWMISLVARVLSPGCRADCVLILEGPQGTRKSSALAILASEPWFADTVGDLSSKDSADALLGKWIIELGELAAHKRSDAETWKAYLARKTDHYRPAYGRTTIDRPRQCVFSGTTNRDDYITDETGARRNLACRVGEIDLEALARDRDQLMAESVARYRSGEQWWLTAEETPGQISEQRDRREADPWRERIAEWCEDQELPITIRRALVDCLAIEPGKQTVSDARRVGVALRDTGLSVIGKTGPRGCQEKVWGKKS